MESNQQLKTKTEQNNSAEVVIDLESEDLTYAQARSIRLKLEKDVL
jgi:hypothetical protein